VCSTETGLADALRHLHDLDRIRCRKAAAERFSAQRMVADHIDVYTRMFNGHQRPHRAA